MQKKNLIYSLKVSRWALFSLSKFLIFIFILSGAGMVFYSQYFSGAVFAFYDEEGGSDEASEADGDNVSGSVDSDFIAGGEKDYEIYVNIPSFTLRLMSEGECVKKYKIRVGKLATKTITGVGSITKKFKTSYFRYSSGPQKGEIIRYSNIRSSYNGKIIKRIKIPYDKIKGLELEINGVITGQIIHATTNPETLGHACSSGCVGLSVEDMLDLYARVKAGTKVLIEYNPVEYYDGCFYFYSDIYKLDLDYVSLIEEIFNSYGISYTDDFIKRIIKKGKKEKKVLISEVYEEMKESLDLQDLETFSYNY